MSTFAAVGKRILPRRLVGQFRQWRRVLRRNAIDEEHLERQALMRRVFTALAFNGIAGDYVEFGCWSGRTFALAHAEIERAGMPRHLWAFDSFKGLPPASSRADTHPVWEEGALAMSLGEFMRACRENEIPESSFDVVPGYYNGTIGPQAHYTGRLPADIAFAYVDCDMHSSTTTVLEFLRDRLKHGMVIAFDDYYCASSTALAGERKALLEFVGRDQRFHFLPYIQFGWHGMSFQLEDRALLPETAHMLSHTAGMSPATT